MFSSFDQIYLLSIDGYNIYQGPPGQVVPFFNSFNFDRARGNPAEFIVEVVFKEPVAKDAICWEKFEMPDSVNRENNTAMDLLPEMKIRVSFGELVKALSASTVFTTLIILSITLLCSMSTVVIVLLHHQIYAHEISNSWYSSNAFSISKTTVDAIVRIIIIVPASLIVIHQSGTPFELFRIGTFIVFLLSFVTIWENLTYCITIFCRASIKKLLSTIALMLVFSVSDLMFIDCVAFDRNL